VAVVVAVPAPATLAAAVGTVGREHVSYSHCGIPFPPRWGDGHSPTSPVCRIAAQGQRGFYTVFIPRQFPGKTFLLPGNFQER
jgi:hypothetical protein